MLVRKIPRGRVTTYGEIATALNRPKAARAVGVALSRNPLPVKIPCHRVIRKDGKIGGYSLGASLKEALLRGEGIRIIDGKIDLKKYIYRFNKR